MSSPFIHSLAIDSSIEFMRIITYALGLIIYFMLYAFAEAKRCKSLILIEIQPCIPLRFLFQISNALTTPCERGEFLYSFGV